MSDRERRDPPANAGAVGQLFNDLNAKLDALAERVEDVIREVIVTKSELPPEPKMPNSSEQPEQLKPRTFAERWFGLTK